MSSPAELKAFQRDFDKIRGAIDEAKAYLQFESARDAANEGMKRNYQAFMDAGSALKRINDSESYKDKYENWPSLCRALGISEAQAYRLIRCVRVIEGIPSEVLERMQVPLSQRQIETLSDLPISQVAEVLEEVIESGDARPTFSKLRETLKAASEARAGKATVDEGEMPKTLKLEKDAAWVKIQTVKLDEWFGTKGLRDAAAPHLAALVRLSVGASGGNASEVG